MFCEMEMDIDENKIENFFGKDLVVEELILLLFFFLLIEKYEEVVFKIVVVLFFVIMVVNEFQEMDEDEGIYSYDGSDLSDNMLEGSDDFGLNGVRLVLQEISRKNVKEVLVVKVVEGDFVCIFCDCFFRKEKDYSKYFNRYLVNVYFFEKVVKGQE